MRHFTGESLERIGQEVNVDKYSTVGSIIERMRMQISRDKKLRKRVEGLGRKFE